VDYRATSTPIWLCRKIKQLEYEEKVMLRKLRSSRKEVRNLNHCGALGSVTEQMSVPQGKISVDCTAPDAEKKPIPFVLTSTPKVSGLLDYMTETRPGSFTRPDPLLVETALSIGTGKATVDFGSRSQSGPSGN